MSIASEIERISTNVQETIAILASVGAPAASDAGSNELPGMATTLAASLGVYEATIE